MGIYNPFPVSFNTFGKLKEIIEQKKKRILTRFISFLTGFNEIKRN